MYYEHDKADSGDNRRLADPEGTKDANRKDRALRATRAQLREYFEANRRFAGSEYQPSSAKNWWLP